MVVIPIHLSMMLRRTPSKCLLCSFRAARKTPQFIFQWTSLQTASLNVRRSVSNDIAPSRMSLASHKSVRSGNERPRRRIQDGPFGGMNLMKASIRGVPERESSETNRLGSGREDSGIRRDRRGDRKDRGFKALKMQRSLSPVSYDQRTRIKAKLVEWDSFSKFPLLKPVLNSIYTQALGGMKDVAPTPVQKIAIPALLGDKNAVGRRGKRGVQSEREEFLIAAETGSGKTLSYVIPTINAIKVAEAVDEDIKEYEKRRDEERLRKNDFSLAAPTLSDIPHPTAGRPRAIILVPTAELVTQVGNVVKSFGHTVKFRSAMISSSITSTVIRSRLFSSQGIDIVVSTPHLLSSIADADPYVLSRVTHLVIDEADSLMDRGFAPLTSAIIDRTAPTLKQLVLCSATIPRSLDSYLKKRYPDIQRLVTPNLHAIPRRVQLGVVNVEGEPYNGNKDLACADTIWSVGKASADHDGPVPGIMDVKRILVFVNEREKTKEVTDYLVSKGIDAMALSRDTSEQRQSEMLASFTTSEPLVILKDEGHPGTLRDNQPNYVPFGNLAPPSKRSLPGVKVVVTTDLGSRGIDTLAVRHVILYDVPHSTIDFIHRLGRTGRMGRRGRGIVLVGKHDRRDIVAEVKEGMFKGQALI